MSVNAYGIYENITFPLIFKVFKPRGTLKEVDTYLSNSNLVSKESVSDFSLHQQWSNKEGWKTTLNNLRLIIQPTILFWMIVPWLDIFPNRSLLLGFHRLIGVMNQFSFYFPDG